jgi:hypothetical protein
MNRHRSAMCAGLAALLAACGSDADPRDVANASNLDDTLGVERVDDGDLGEIRSSDHAETLESSRVDVTGGARGGVTTSFVDACDRGHAGSAALTGGVRFASIHYRGFVSLGESPGGNRIDSPSYQISAGLVGATQGK